MKGFFEMYNGDKPDSASYLPSILKIAEDGQNSSDTKNSLPIIHFIRAR
jgi:hypothetical protein